MLNKVMLIGNLGDDPEISYLPSGTQVAYFSLATNESYRDRETGEMKQTTEWHRIKMYGRLAERAEQYLGVGQRVYLEGKNRTRTYLTEDESERQVTEVVCHHMSMLGGRKNTDGTGSDLIPDEVGGTPTDDEGKVEPPVLEDIPF